MSDTIRQDELEGRRDPVRPKNAVRRRFAPLALAAVMAFTQTRCGILFHPERSGNEGGRLAVFSVLLDCCWLFVGVVPGVVALAIDFASGGAWFSTSELVMVPGERVALRIPGPAPAACDVSLRVVDAGGRDLAVASRAHVAKGARADGISVEIPARAPVGASLVLAIDGREQGRWALARAE